MAVAAYKYTIKSLFQVYEKAITSIKYFYHPFAAPDPVLSSIDVFVNAE